MTAYYTYIYIMIFMCTGVHKIRFLVFMLPKHLIMITELHTTSEPRGHYRANTIMTIQQKYANNFVQ